MPRRLSATVIAAVIATTAGAAVQAADLKICVEGAYPPFSSIAADGSIQGFDIDIANALCEQMGTSCALVPTEWVAIVPALLERRCDAIVASMSNTGERREVMDFSTKYYNTPARFVGRKGMTLDDLGPGTTVGVLRDSVHLNFVRDRFPRLPIRPFATGADMFQALAAGEIAAVMADSVGSQQGFLGRPTADGFDYFGPDYADPAYHGLGAAVAVRQSEEDLRNAFSHAIGALRANGTYQTINGRYFDFDIFGG